MAGDRVVAYICAAVIAGECHRLARSHILGIKRTCCRDAHRIARNQTAIARTAGAHSRCGVAVIRLAGSRNAGDGQGLGRDAGAGVCGRGGEGVVACLATCKRQAGKGHAVGGRHVLAIESAHCGAGDADRVAGIGLAVAGSACARSLGREQCGSAYYRGRGVAVVGLAAGSQTRSGQRLGRDGGAGRALDGQGVVACFGPGKAQPAKGDRAGSAHVLVVVSAGGGAGDADGVAGIGLAVSGGARACSLKTCQCGCAADHGAGGSVVDLAARHRQAAHGDGLGGDGAGAAGERAAAAQVVVGCIGAAQGEGVDGEALVAAAHALGGKVAIARDADHIVGFQAGQAQRDVVHGGGAVVDLGQARGGGGEALLVDSEVAHHHQVVAEVVAGFCDTRCTDAIATCLECAVGTGLCRLGPQCKDGGSPGTIAVGVGIAAGSRCGQGVDDITAIEVFGTGNRVARCGAVSEGCVVYRHQQLASRHDGVGARCVGNAVVAVVSSGTRRRE